MSTDLRPARRPRPRRVVKAAAPALLLLLTLTSCTRADFESKFRFGWHTGVTKQAEKMRVLWTWAGLTALAVGIVVWGLIFWCLIVYRRRKGTPPEELPRQTKYNLPIEWVYTIVPFFLIIGLFFYTARTENYVNHESKNPDVTIQVDAFKWNWQFEYMTYHGQKSTFHDTNAPVNTVGTSTEVPVLLVPVNQTVRIVEHSYDVIHSFWVPQFLFKRDVIPHGTSDTSKDNSFEFTAVKEGSYVGRCAELCGIYHSEMNFEVRVVPADVYQNYLTKLASIGASNPARQSEALSSVGLAPYSTTTAPFDTNRTARQASGTQVDVSGAPAGAEDMKIENRMFLLIAVFLVVVAAGYAVWTNIAYGDVEWVGLVALLLSAGLMGLSGGFFWFISRRIDLRPEDRADAEIAEGAGELGFFSPGSYWPVGIAAAAALTGIAMAFVEVWLIATGIVLLLSAVGGLLFEYYIGGRRAVH